MKPIQPRHSMRIQKFRESSRIRRVLQHSIVTVLVAAAVAGDCSFHAEAQDAGALINILVRKGVLTDKEAEEVRAELKKEVASTSAAKLKLSESLKELKLYGDIRLRYQYDNKDFQEDPLSVGTDGNRSPSGTQRSRWRFRLRLNADFKLAENFFGGVELQTNRASDSANQTFEDAYRDYEIFISKAFIGWSPNEWLTLTGGKVPNPFYTTELVWDPDINPTGITEQIAFHKMHFGGASGGYTKDGKSAAPLIQEERPWELTLIAGQFIYDDNQEGGGRDPGITDNDETTDAFAFQTQLVGSYKFRNGIKITLAPGWLVYNAASVFGADNENPFNDNEFVSGAARNLSILLFPGEIDFKIADIKTKVYWDFAYNTKGRQRVEDTYSHNNVFIDVDGRLRRDRLNNTTRDDIAWLVGIQLGENRKKHDWSLLLNYRETGLGSVDPNINDSDFALAELNTRGYKLSLAYNLTDFAMFSLTWMQAWQIRDIKGGEATGGNAIADENASQVLQVDLNVKF